MLEGFLFERKMATSTCEGTEKRNLCTLLVKTHTGIVTLENKMQVPQKPKYIFNTTEIRMSKRCLHSYVLSSTIRLN